MKAQREIKSEPAEEDRENQLSEMMDHIAHSI